MLPHRHQVDFARRKGKVPYPCYYCMNNVAMMDIETDEHNMVKSFGTEGGVPRTCMAGLTGPTEKGDCKAIMVLELPQCYTRCYPSSLFTKLTREYYMEMLTDILYRQPVVRSELVCRANKGYHTREQRITEMLDEGLITKSYHNCGEEMYSLTAFGRSMAILVSSMIEDYLMVCERGEILAYSGFIELFEWIRENPNSTAKQIYDSYRGRHGLGAVIETTLEDLVSAEYVEPMFDKDYDEIRYNVTQKGINVWKMILERQSRVPDATEPSK